MSRYFHVRVARGQLSPYKEVVAKDSISEADSNLLTLRIFSYVRDNYDIFVDYSYVSRIDIYLPLIVHILIWLSICFNILIKSTCAY